MAAAPQTAIALTIGEPAGIGPEIAAMAWSRRADEAIPAFFMIGDADAIAVRARESGINAEFAVIASPARAGNVFGSAVPVLHSPLPEKPVAGRPAPANAPAVIAAIERAAALALDGHASAVVTNPIQKDSLYQAGFAHQGHTDFLAHLARLRGFEAQDVMMLVARDLRAIPITVHVPLSKVPHLLTQEAIVTQARIVARDLARCFGIARPRLAFTGLNPHAGEGGAMGTEEQTVIVPALRILAGEGFTVAGPLPADTAFHEDARRNYDAILCMYHDQALIPVKTLDFHGGVNVTLGLPFVRTSPDHGTALDLAGRGTANPRSLIAALKLAERMARHAAG